MSVKIKLQRRGRTKRPIYRLVIQDSKTARDGKIIDIVGHYNPLIEPMMLTIEEEKVKTWLANGAQPTEAVARLLALKGLLEAKVYPKKETPVEEIKEEPKEVKAEVVETVEEKAEEVASSEKEETTETIEKEQAEEKIAEVVLETEIVEEKPEEVEKTKTEKPNKAKK